MSDFLWYELASLVVIPHTTTVRGDRWEVYVPKPFLKSPGVFDLSQIQPADITRFERPLGVLTPDELKRVKDTLVEMLNLHG
jgi:mRNA interferase MazF